MKNRFLCALVLAVSMPLAANAAVSLFINIAPPPLPIYVQPAIPASGFLWTPGYWRWSPVDGDYFWVPGTWVAPPAVGLLWTPGYWGWGGGGYLWYPGYWGRHVGFYGGINYGFGYFGHGYEGGYWRGREFNYNRSVNNINTTIVRNVYNTTVVDNHARVSFNGGQGGVAVRASADERRAHAEPHIAPTPLQRQHEQVAMRLPEQRASFNHGAPTLAAMPRPQAGGRGEGVARPQVTRAGDAGVPRPPVSRPADGAARPQAARGPDAVPRPPLSRGGAGRPAAPARVEAQRVERGGPRVEGQPARPDARVMRQPQEGRVEGPKAGHEARPQAQPARNEAQGARPQGQAPRGEPRAEHQGAGNRERDR